MLATIDFGQILQVIGASMLAAIVVSVLFSLVIYGSTRAAECRRADEGPAAAYGALAAVSMIAFLGVAVFGITVILNKS